MSPDNPGARPSEIMPGHDVCNLCGAIGNGNVTCWACVDRWDYPDELRNQLVVELRKREPAKPCDGRDVRDFLAMLEAYELAKGKSE